MRWALLGLFASLPLQWFIVPSLVLGPQRLHLVCIAAFTALVVARYRARALAPVTKTALPLLIAAGVFIVMWAATNFYHSYGFRGPLQEAIQLFALVAVGTVVYRAAAYPSTRILELARWAALVTGVVLVVALSVSMRSNGVDPVATFAQTVAQGDPEILQKGLFKSAFAGYGVSADAVQGNIRHEVFGALLAAMFLSSAAVRLRPLTSATERLVYRASMVFGTALVVISLSRSVMIAALIWLVLEVTTQVRRHGLTARQLSAAAIAVIGVAALLLSGFASVLYVRFTQDTASYQARDTLLVDAIHAIPQHFWTGGVQVQGNSSHMFVIDSTVRAGVLAGLAALTVTLLLAALFLQLAMRLPAEPSWMLPVTAALALPITRLFTAGGGVIPPVQYILLGVVAGFVTYRIRLGQGEARRSTAAEVPDDLRALEPLPR